MKKTLPLLLLTAALFVGCSEHTHDSKYHSDCPRFSAMTQSTETVKAGQAVTFTCVESRAGKLLNTTFYTWTFTPSDGVASTPSAAEGGLYDGKNPTCTVVFPHAGTYTVTFRGDYAGSGQVEYFEESATLDDGTTARYTANTASDTSPQRDYLHATLSKRVVVTD